MPASPAATDPARALRHAWNALRPSPEKQRYSPAFESSLTALQARGAPLSGAQTRWLDTQLRRAGTGTHGVFVLASAPATLLRDQNTLN